MLAVALLVGLGIGALPAGELSATISAVGESAGECTFHRGVTTCVSLIERTETIERVVTSGCLAGPTGVPGVRRSVFSDIFTVTERTVTESHGRNGPEFDAVTSTVRTLTSSTLISSTCEPIAVSP
jgi:hypothetical protein